MATKKSTADQVKVAMAKVEAAKAAEAAKESAKAEKAPAKAAAEKKAPAKTTKAATTKKAPAKKTTTKMVQTVYVQACGYEVTTADIEAKVVAVVGKKVKELNIYVKPEEGMIYYTADGEQGSVEL